jgi:hypothetical protein
LTTRVASASPSTSSAMISRLRPCFATCSRIGRRSFIDETFFSYVRMYASLSETTMRSWSVMKYGLR